MEVLVDTSLDECARRDPKGLYARARAELVTSTLPGVGVSFERPERPDVLAGADDPDVAVRALAAARAT